MDIERPCLIEQIAQDRVEMMGGVHPAQCLVREECIGEKNLICLRVQRGENLNGVVLDLANQALESEKIAEGLFKKKE